MRSREWGFIAGLLLGALAGAAGVALLTPRGVPAAAPEPPVGAGLQLPAADEDTTRRAQAVAEATLQKVRGPAQQLLSGTAAQ
jgi:hypothetical protein